MIADHKFNAFDVVKSSIKFTITPIYSIVDFPSSVYQYLNRKDDSKQITKEFLTLKTKEQTYNSLLLENQRLSEMLGTSYDIVDNNFVLARITNIKQSRLKKQIIIDKGSRKNIKNGDIVLSKLGVIGRVINTAINHSTIRLITDPLHYLPAINSRSGERGVISGVASQENFLIIKHTDPKADIKIGDIFITSNKAGVFSKGFEIGKVTDIIQNNNNFVDIILSPSQNINSTIFVLVDTKL
jgi:rod shape-determining protein MreC